jgi:hypothetical protein
MATRLHRHRVVSVVKNRLDVAVLILIFAGVGFSVHAHAYLDPGSGSYAFQLLISGLFALIFATKSLWRRVLMAFRRSVGEKQRQ